MSDKPPVIVTARKPRRLTRPKVKGEAPAMPQRIVTSRKPGSWRARSAEPDLSPEELQRRGDAADELWRELVRRVSGIEER